MAACPDLSIIHSRDEILNGVYTDSAGLTTKTIPKDDIPELLYRGYAVGDVVKVDYYITGCPPKEAFLRQILLPLIEGNVPELAEKVGLLGMRPQHGTGQGLEDQAQV